MLAKDDRRIYCKYCGAKLVRDIIGWRCPTKNCQWEHGMPDIADTERKGNKNG
jgi:hypothetical protein